MRRQSYYNKRIIEARNNLYRVLGFCIIWIAGTTWTRHLFPVFLYWFLVLLFGGLTIYIVIVLVTKYKLLEQPVIRQEEEDKEVTAIPDAPVIIEKDYSVIDVEAWAEEIVTLWKKQKAGVNRGAAQQEIDDAEKLLGFTFPPAFHALYRKANGMDDYLPNVFSVWPLKRIIQEYNGDEDKNFISFADGLINCWYIGFKKDEAGIFNSNLPSERIADNYMHAIDLINGDSALVY